MEKTPIWLYKLVQPIAAFALKIVYRPKIINKEVIPKEGPIILAGNHKMAFDPVLVTCGTKRTIHFMAKDVFFKGFKGFLFRSAGTLPVHVGKVHKDSFVAAIKILKQGESIGIFPEGTRNRTEKLLLPFKKGAVTLAKETNTKIIPLAISGRYLPFHGLTIEYGDPIDVSNMELEEANQLLEEKVRELLLKNQERISKKTNKKGRVNEN